MAVNGEILLVSEDRLFSRMLILELRRFHVTVKLRPTITADILEQALTKERLCLLILDLDGVYPGLERTLNLTVEQNLPVILFGYPDSETMTAEKLRFYESDIYRYVFPRPFLMNQFVYCVKELLKYREELLPDTDEPAPMKMKQHSPADDLFINEEAHTVTYRKEPVALTRTEYDVLLLLLRMRGVVLSRSDIYRVIRKEKADEKKENSNIVDVYIRFLRAKLDQTYRVTLIETVRGVGYTIRK